MTSRTRTTASSWAAPALRALRTTVARTTVALAALAACGPSTLGSDCKALLPGDLVISEVFADFKATAAGTGSDTGKEWFEIYNASAQPIELEGLTITHTRSDGSRPNAHTMTGATIAPDQFLTLGNAAPELVPPYVDYGYGPDLGDLFNTNAGKLVLSCEGREVDSATYEEVKQGHSRALTAAQPPEYTLNDRQDSWCQASDTEFEAGNFGTPGSDNDCRPIVAGQCNDAGTMRPAVAPVPGDLVITEVMPSPEVADDATGEWFEARVIHSVDLNGVGLDRAGDRRKPDIIISTDCVRAAAGSYVVFARSTASGTNGGLAASIVGTFGFTMVGGSATAPGDVAILAGTTVIDAVRWTSSRSGKALQLDPDLVDPIANDTESNFCDATAPYGLAPPAPDLGTPGAANTQCTRLPGAGMCDDGGRLRAIARPAPGKLVISELLANPANIDVDGERSVDAQREWFEIVNTGATAFDLNGLTVSRIGATGLPVQSGHCLSVSPGGFAVFARSSEPAVNSMIPRVDATFRFGLVDTNGDIQISDGATVLDEIRWASVTPGVTRQIDPAHLTTADNDVAGNVCAGAVTYGDGSNQGTPGTANATCP